MSKKNVKKEKRVLSNAEGDEPCMCGHERREHLAEDSSLCWGCCTAEKNFDHEFKLDNLALIEKLYNQKELNKFKNG